MGSQRVGDDWATELNWTVYVQQYGILIIRADSCVCAQSLSGVWLFATPMDCSLPGSYVHRVFFRQEHWSGLPCPTPGDLSNSGIKPRFPALQADSLPSEPPGKLHVTTPKTGTQDCHIIVKKLLHIIPLYPYPYIAQSCPTLCNPVDCSPPGSAIHGILWARILEWVAISSSRGSSQPRDWIQVSPHCRQTL